MVNTTDISLSAGQTKKVWETMAEAAQKQAYLYPWEELEQQLERSGLAYIPIVAYGSLLNIESAAQTLTVESLVRRRPVIAFGARRLFNYQMTPRIGRYGPPTRLSARAALNVRMTGKIEDAINGLVVQASPGEIPTLRDREIGYNLVPVACLGWKEMEDPPFLAYILSCPDDPRQGGRLVNDRIEPHPKYYLTCRKGAAEFGEDFLRFWLATTYLADGVTPVARWERTEFPDLEPV
jgi:hypothetical protein